MQTQKNYLQTFLIITIALILFLYLRSCSKTTSNENTYRQNLAALQDSIRTYTTKNGELIFEKSAIISENNQLKNLNSDLDNEIKNLKDNPIVVIKTKIVVQEKPVKIPVYPNGSGNWNEDKTTFKQYFNWSKHQRFDDENWRKMSGNFAISVDTSFLLSSSEMSIDTNKFGMALTTGLTENKQGLLEIFVKSNYPGFTITKLDGALIEPSKSEVLKKYFPQKRWGLGVYTGYGIYLDPVNIRSGTAAQVGIGLQYNIVQWNSSKIYNKWKQGRILPKNN
jgi:hypothetical protein